MEKLKQKLMRDLDLLGLPTDFDLDLRGYSKIYNGRYDPNPPNGKLILYPLKRNGDFRDYNVILKIAIHEAIHHYQWKHDSNYVREKGVMHNVKFKSLERKYLGLARDKKLI